MLDEVAVTVTQADIDAAEETRGKLNGDMLYIASCPIARAVRRIPEFEEFVVNAATINRISANEDEFVAYVLPPEATKLVVDFDSGKSVKPLAFIAEKRKHHHE